MEMENAVILAKYLRDVPEFSAAFASYERLRRRRVERIVAEGARQSGNKALGPVGRMLRDLMVRLDFGCLEQPACPFRATLQLHWRRGSESALFDRDYGVKRPDFLEESSIIDFSKLYSFQLFWCPLLGNSNLNLRLV